MNIIDSTMVTPLSNVRMSEEGYLVADAFCVRTGIQDYLGSEVGRPDLSKVRVYRPEEEVFKNDSIATFSHKPITVDHPPGGVDSSTWKNRAVGEVGTEVLRDGQRLRLSLIVKDNSAIAKIKDGSRRELSAGYRCDLDWTPGLTADGEPYDAIQRNININHLALVQRGRAGNCRIGDADPWGTSPIMEDGEHRMATKTMTYDGVPVEVTPAAEAIINKLTADNAKLGTDLTTAVADKARLEGEALVLKKQVEDNKMTPDRLSKMVADRQALMGDFKKVTGGEADQNLSDSDIKRVAVSKVLGDSAKDLVDAAIDAAFATLVATKTTVTQDSAPGPLRQFMASDTGSVLNFPTHSLADSLKAEEAAYLKSTADLNTSKEA